MEEGQSKYCYPNSDVLINKLGIVDDDLLNEVERIVTTFRIAQLVGGMKQYIDGKKTQILENKNDFMSHMEYMYHHFFKVDTYLAIHKYLFHDIYDFAGNIRDEAISKSNEPYFHNKTPFCYPSFIFEQLKEYLDKMNRTFCRISTRDQLLDFLSYYYGEFNVIHPFREGNGRTLRTFMTMLVDYLNFQLDLGVELQYSLWNDDDRENLLKSTIISNITGNTDGIRECFDKVLVSTQIKKKSK